MRVLVAGAAGFVGSHLVDRLLADGHSVLAIDNLVTGRPQNLAHLNGHARLAILDHDISTPLSVSHSLDWVMHLASPASPPKYQDHTIETMRANADGTRHLLDLAAAKGAGFFLASTSEVYGDPGVHPQPETYWGNVNPIGPRSVYDEAKRYAEAYTYAFQRRHGLQVRVARIFNTYGPRMDPADGRVVTNFLVQALRGVPLTIYGDGTQTRSFQYISDLVEGISRLMATDYSSPVNLGNPRETTLLKLAQKVLEVTGSTSPIAHLDLPEDDPCRRRPDISLARRLLNWQPTVPLEEGLRLTAVYLRRHEGLGV